MTDAAARQRIRAGLAPRLASEASTRHPGWGPSAWLGVGAAVVGVGAVAVWLMSAATTNERHAVATMREPVATMREPVATPPTLEATPPASAAPPSAEAPRPAPSLEVSRPTPAPARSVDPAEELQLVRAMQQALRSGNPGQALTLAADHARRFPRGTLVEEREGVRAVARCRLAAPDARLAILSAFTERFATSPYAARVKAACQ
jgi:hypothetical protein